MTECPGMKKIDVWCAGALLGACCGDAAGAALEFYPNPIEADTVAWALSMPGGGQLHIGKGQITDDTELAVSLTHALIGRDVSAGFPEEAVAEAYRAWFRSGPFDVGQTISNACFISEDEYVKGFLAETVRKRVKKVNFWSESNGAMMRCIPMAIWLRGVEWKKAIEMIKAETTLTHSSPAAIDANVAYLLAVRYLLMNPGGIKGAIAAAESYIYGGADPKVIEWYNQSREDIRMKKYVAKPKIGHVRHAFMLAFYHLRKASGFKEAMEHTLLAGGDTDTNAAIVGGMIGALVGYHGIPDEIKMPVLEFDCTAVVTEWGKRTGHKRPIEYSVQYCFDRLLDDNILTYFTNNTSV